MPVQAAPGDRDAVEAALPAELHQALAVVCGLLELPFGPAAARCAGWQGPAPLQQLVETVAAVALAAELEAEGLPTSKAEAQAAARLGLSAHTVRNRLIRWQASAYAKTNTHNEGRSSADAA